MTQLLNYSKAEAAIRFIESLRHSKAHWNGKKIRLEEVQKEWIRKLLAEDTEGNRIYTRAMFFLPRKNGKSFLNSALGLYFLCCDGEQSEIVCAASTADQATVIFNEAAAMVRQNKTLDSVLDIRDSRKTIYYKKKNSSLRAISADADSKHGGNASHILADEIHVWQDSSLWDVLRTSQGARKNPLAIAITTAGVYRPEHFCYKMYKLAKAVEANPELNPSFLPIIYEYTGQDWKNEESWKIANPFYGIITQKRYWDEKIAEIEHNPSELNIFLQVHLNQWVNASSRWISGAAWAACGAKIVTEESCLGRECFAGFDLATVADLCAFCLVFPNDDGSYDILPYCWIPRDTAIKREHTDKVPYLTWINQGRIEATEGNVIDYDVIRKRINELGKKFRIQQIAVDTLYQGFQVAEQLKQDGFDVVSFRQTYVSMVVPTREFEKLVISGKLHHGNHPVTNWNISNAIVTHDSSGNIKVDKAKSTEKVDAIVSGIMGLGLAMAKPKAQMLSGNLFIRM